MTAAVALAVVLVIAVAGLSLAMQTQRPAGPQAPGPRPRPSPPGARRSRERKPQPEAASPAPPSPAVPDPEPRGPELLRSGAQAQARVISVVDERTVGPVTRSRLTLEIDPDEGDKFQVTTRTAFPSPAARAAVKVGGTVPVRYDPKDHARVVLDVQKDEPKGDEPKGKGPDPGGGPGGPGAAPGPGDPPRGEDAGG